MLVDYNLMPNTSKTWIYQSNKELTDIEVEQVKTKIENFIKQWKRHGDDLKASYQIKYNQFIVLFVDESYNNVSGCSIDSSVNLIKQLEKEFSVDLTNKLNISFKDTTNINIVSLSDFQKYAKEEKITSNTIVFNNLVTTKADFEENWEVTADKSWHKRFLVQ
ncbi:ABC transporter ATPase [Lutibacter sp. B1]|uniref:ABC transporter ATPase n=1 Tax=Lutibacter sp. B1 TaxID=2725996 RepID=UPI0014577DE0|nr:ABC transporter ATPase [Lutibacter sp. B1]NLP56698.1 ABC transporter ATPase [Lutibacter sp. B1]